jgi:hypothetical protein
MRTILAVTAAALLLAAPAAAQPNASVVMRQALERLHDNHGPDVRDYSLTVVHEDARMPVYVLRGDDGWVPRTGQSPMSDLLGMAVFWPPFTYTEVDREAMEAEAATAVYVGQEEVDGRPAHLLTVFPSADQSSDAMESMMLWVDTETHQIRRMSVTAAVPEMDPQILELVGDDARLVITLDARDHAETDGLVMPRQVRVGMRIESAGLTDEVRETIGTQARKALEGPEAPKVDAPTRALILMFLQLFAPGGMKLSTRLDEVRVNPGPPAWLDEPDF